MKTTTSEVVAPLTIDIHYNMSDLTKSVIRTNIKTERLSDILADYIQSQIGKGSDDRESKAQEEYHITISLDLSFDTFQTTSDTGNEGLTVGIILHVLNNLENIKIT